MRHKHHDMATGEITYRDYTEEEEAARVKASEESDIAASLLDRNALLATTDIYGLSDITMSSAMKTYRQALRDLPDHSNWPNLSNSDWPEKPS